MGVFPPFEETPIYVYILLCYTCFTCDSSFDSNYKYICKCRFYMNLDGLFSPKTVLLLPLQEDCWWIHGPRTQMIPIFEGQPPPKQGRKSNQNRSNMGSRDTLVQSEPFPALQAAIAPPSHPSQPPVLSDQQMAKNHEQSDIPMFNRKYIGEKSRSIFQLATWIFQGLHVSTTTFRCCYCQTSEPSVVSEALALVKASVLATSRKKWRLVGLPEICWGKKNWSTENCAHKVDGWNPTYP